MKQVLPINNLFFCFLAKEHQFFLLIVFQLITYVAVSQNTPSPPTLVLALEFNDASNPSFESLNKESLSYAQDDTKYKVEDGFIRLGGFNSKGYFKMVPSPFFGKLNPERIVGSSTDTHGYTIMIKIKSDGLTNPKLEQQIFWVKDKSQRVIYGFKKLGKKLVFQRYARDFKDVNQKIIGTWDFDLWNPEQFGTNNVDYTILVSVTESLFRVKVYSGSYNFANSLENNKDTQKCACELVYLGGQELRSDEISALGFGSPDDDKLKTEAIYGIDYFRIYANSISSFDEMDTFYNTNKEELSPNGKYGEIVSNNKLNVDIDPIDTTMDLKIFPNPVNKGKELFTQFSLKQADKVILQIFGLSGELIRSDSFNASMGINILPVNINGINSGMYIIKVQGGQISKASKIIISE